MITKNNDESVEINPNPNRPYVPDHPYKILIIAGSGLGKIDMLLNLIHYQLTDIEKVYLQVKDPFESKYPLLIDFTEKVRIKKLQKSKTNKRIALIKFHDMILDMEANWKLRPTATDLFLRERKIKVSLAFMPQSYFKVPKL